MNCKNCLRYAQALALGLVTLAVAATPSFAQNLVALEATATMPDGTVIPMWGFFNDTGQACTTVETWGVGPQINATSTGTVTVNLRNCLSEDISIFIPGQAKSTSPVTFTPAGDTRARVSSFDEVTAPGLTKSYTWANVRAGTFMYHSGTHPQVQVQMGLYGVLAVDAYPVDHTVVFSEIDPALHDAVDGGTYGTPAYPSTFDYHPKYYLINGASYPAGSDLSVVTSESTVFRFVNAGLKNRVPTLQGLYMTLLAEDGFAYPDPMEQYSVLLAPGKTIDAAITAGADGKFALYDRALGLTNSAATGGGMLTYIVAGASTGAPTAVNDSYSTDEDVQLVVAAPGVLSNDDDGTGTSTIPANAALVSGPSAGSLALAANGSFTYTPNAYFNGTDLFTYTANDGLGGLNSNVATVSITVNPVNNTPVAAADAYTAPQGGTLSVAAPGVLGNDSDVDGDALTATLFGALPAGSLVLNPNGSFDYTPAGLAGEIETFSYQACDPSSACATAVVTITVGAPPANIAPTAFNVNAQTLQNTAVTFNVTFNDEDPDGFIDVATVDLNPGVAGRQTIVTTQRGGTATVDSLGNVTFDPKRGFRGTDLFTYTVNDDDGATSNVATVRINVKK